jgi:hypothetical protein
MKRSYPIRLALIAMVIIMIVAFFASCEKEETHCFKCHGEQITNYNTEEADTTITQDTFCGITTDQADALIVTTVSGSTSKKIIACVKK